MKTRKLAMAVLILAALAAPLLLQHRATVRLRANDEQVRQRAEAVARLSSENDRLSILLAHAKKTQSLSDTQLTELLQLRNAVGQLRGTLKEMDQLRREIDRIRDALQKQAEQRQSNASNNSPTALLADEMPLRQARIAELKRWLEERPEEKIPELQFLSEDVWVKQANWQAVTDEDYHGHMSALRGNAEMKFAEMTHQALKQYAQANDGRFPSELSQLTPYYEQAVDDAILQRYTIVPAKSLTFLDGDWKGGEWVVTQKAPVNRKYDGRVAVGFGDWRGTVQAGRWDSVR
jgi:hypothetical protein